MSFGLVEMVPPPQNLSDGNWGWAAPSAVAVIEALEGGLLEPQRTKIARASICRTQHPSPMPWFVGSSPGVLGRCCCGGSILLFQPASRKTVELSVGAGVSGLRGGSTLSRNGRSHSKFKESRTARNSPTFQFPLRNRKVVEYNARATLLYEQVQTLRYPPRN